MFGERLVCIIDTLKTSYFGTFVSTYGNCRYITTSRNIFLVPPPVKSGMFVRLFAHPQQRELIKGIHGKLFVWDRVTHNAVLFILLVAVHIINTQFKIIMIATGNIIY